MYAIARQSTVKMIIDEIAKFSLGQVEYSEWDAHAETYKLPQKDLIGLVAFSCTENDTFHDLTFGVVIMTYNDPGLSRSTRYIDQFYRRLQAQRTWQMFDEKGLATDFKAVVFDGTSVSPMSRVDARPTTEIMVSARVTRAGLPR